MWNNEPQFIKHFFKLRESRGTPLVGPLSLMKGRHKASPYWDEHKMVRKEVYWMIFSLQELTKYSFFKGALKHLKIENHYNELELVSVRRVLKWRGKNLHWVIFSVLVSDFKYLYAPWLLTGSPSVTWNSLSHTTIFSKIARARKHFFSSLFFRFNLF